MPLMFPAGSTNSTMECVNVSITEDGDAVEGDETFTVTLIESDIGVMIDNSETIVTIMDNEGMTESHSGNAHQHISSHSCHGIPPSHTEYW